MQAFAASNLATASVKPHPSAGRQGQAVGFNVAELAATSLCHDEDAAEIDAKEDPTCCQGEGPRHDRRHDDGSLRLGDVPAMFRLELVGHLSMSLAV